jgi:hypothetical protein
MFRAACLLGLLPAIASAQLASPTPTHHVGTVKGGVVVSHHFELHNRGELPLELLEVRTGCGCLKAQPDRRSFAPGEKGSIRLQVQTVTQPAGPNVWGAEVRYRTARGEGVLNLRLTGQVSLDRQIRPAALVIHTAATIRHPFTLIEQRAKPVTLKAVTTSSPHVRVMAGPPMRQGEGWVRTLQLVVQPNCPEGRHECILSLVTDDPACPELNAPFTVVKKARDTVQASPSALEWTELGGDPLPAQLTVLRGGDERPVVVEAVTFTHPAFKATWVSGPRATLRIAVDRDQLPDGGVQAAAEVKLSSPAERTIRIPLTVRIP